jgi:hypothetical protein
MKYLTSLDFTTLVNTGKSIEKQLSEKDLHIKNMEEQTSKHFNSYDIHTSVYDGN